MKTCRVCQQNKPLDAFHKHSISPDGRQSRCKECAKMADAARYADPETRDAMLARNRQWYRENREAANERHKARRRAINPPRIRPDVPDGHKHCTRCDVVRPVVEFHRWRKGVDGLFSHCKSCVSESGRQRYAANADTIKAQTRAWRERNPERARALAYVTTMTYFARKRAAAVVGHVPIEKVEARRAMWGGACYLCGEAASAMDHVIPLSRGGLHVPANLRPVCRECNSSKGARDWRPYVAATA